MQLLMVSTLKEQISKECHHNVPFILSLIDDFIISGTQIVYKTEKAELGLNSNIVGVIGKLYKQKFHLRPWLPKFTTTDVETPARLIYENNQFVNYEESIFYSNIMTKPHFKKLHRPQTPKPPKNLTPSPTKIANKDKAVTKSLLVFKEAIESNKTILSFDVEWHEISKNKILEIGYSLFTNGVTTSENILISENIDLLNGTHVPNHKHDFQFGQSKYLPFEEAISYFNAIFETSDFYLGHSLSNDFSILGLFSRPEKVLDITTFFNHYKVGARNPVSLGKMCGFLDIETKYLHNAGNDAFYSLQCALTCLENQEF